MLIVEGHKAQEDDLPADALRTLALLQAELPLKRPPRWPLKSTA